jgi:hypothetical protein
MFHWEPVEDEVKVDLFYSKNRVRRFVSFNLNNDMDEDEMRLFIEDELKRNSVKWSK